MVAKLLDECIACTTSYDPKARESLVMTELPSRKWSHLCADFYGPLPSGEYLLVVLDEYSRFPEVEIVKSLSAQTVIPIFDKVFSSRGIPENLKTDNGSPFQSSEFRNFANDLGFQHQRITPYWPEANGVAERFMRTIGKVCKCAQVDGKSWKQELYRFLRNYRATPHTSTGLPPATVLNGVPLKTKLPQVYNTQDDKLLRQKDQSAKNSMKEHAEARRNIRRSDIKVGDKVLLKNVTQTGKLVPKFQKQPFEVIKRKGVMVTAQRGQEIKARNVSHFRKVVTEAIPLPHLTGELDHVPHLVEQRDHVPRQPDEPDPAPPITTDVHPPQPASPVGHPATPVVAPQNIPSPVSRPQRLRSVPKRLDGFDVTLPSFTK